MRMRRQGTLSPLRCILAVALAALSACAPVAPPTIVVPQYPDYLFPAIPIAFMGTSAAARHQDAWLFLQAGDLPNAQRGFVSALDTRPSFYPAVAGLGYVGLARGEYREAVAQFNRSLSQVPTYVPALVGRGEALLASNRVDEALESFRGCTWRRTRTRQRSPACACPQIRSDAGAGCLGPRGDRCRTIW